MLTASVAHVEFLAPGISLTNFGRLPSAAAWARLPRSDTTDERFAQLEDKLPTVAQISGALLRAGGGGLAPGDVGGSGAECGAQFGPRRYPELGEDPVQVRADGAVR